MYRFLKGTPPQAWWFLLSWCPRVLLTLSLQKDPRHSYTSHLTKLKFGIHAPPPTTARAGAHGVAPSLQ